MKKATFILGALALVLGLSQCRKQDMPTVNGGNGETIVQQATVGATCNGGNSKVDGQIIGNALKLTWEQPDVIEVGIPDKSDKSTLTLSGPAGETSGKFTGTITGQTGDKLTFFYKAAYSEIYLDNEGYVTTDEAQFKNQNGKLEKTEDNKASVKNSILDRLCAYAQNIDFISSSAAEYDVDLEVPYAILKLDLSYFGTAAGNKVSIMIGNYEVASVTGVTNEANHPYYVAMSAAHSYEYTFSGNGKTAKVTWKLDKNTYYTKSDGHGGSTGDAIVVAPAAPVLSFTNFSVYPVANYCTLYVYLNSTPSQQCSYGFVYSTSQNPTVENGILAAQDSGQVGSGFDGVPIDETIDLVSTNTYYVRAYAKGENGVYVYSEQKEFDAVVDE